MHVHLGQTNFAVDQPGFQILPQFGETSRELQPSQTPRLKQQPEEQTKKKQQTLQVKFGQFLENSVIKAPMGIDFTWRQCNSPK